MLKIKDSVDLKELEKFNYEDFGNCYKKYYNGAEIFINKETKKITRLHPFSLREEPNYEEVSELIFPVDMVEKVEG